MDFTAQLQAVFAQNRSEELGYDVWAHFVIPPFFDRLNLGQTYKPRVILGGRGCGKTMLLRYLSHHSTFSRRRQRIPPDAINHIGLYYRADTQFARMMTNRAIEPDVWEAAYKHLLAVLLGIEVLRSLQTIAASSYQDLTSEALSACTFARLQAFDASLPTGFHDCLAALEDRFCAFESWVANVRKRPEPMFLPGTAFLLALISQAKQDLPAIQNSTFFVYIDEFENLHEYQQRIVNTCIKHSEPPLVFNIAMKRNGFFTTRTLGEESISDIADYRTYDLEAYVLDGSFDLFAAEVLCLSLALAGAPSLPVDPATLQDVEQLPARRRPDYRERVLSRIREMLPGMTHERLAQTVLETDALRRKLVEKVNVALRSRSSRLDSGRFVRESQPMASVIVPALLHRDRDTPEAILAELDQLDAGRDNRFTGRTGWIHNNFIACLLAIYDPHSRPCPFYSGFDTFCLLSRGNLRHFLELCHRSISIALEAPDCQEPLAVTPIDQALAARQTSAAFLGQVRSFGRFGNRLHRFALSLGSLFAISHQRPTQSEPEQCHFSIVPSADHLSDSEVEFIAEAVKWSVLFEEEETKQKDPLQPASFEYVLNPIYSPYFHITYRKRRKLELVASEFRNLAFGSYDDVSSLLRRFSHRWSVDLTDVDPTLFSHLSPRSTP